MAIKYSSREVSGALKKAGFDSRERQELTKEVRNRYGVSEGQMKKILVEKGYAMQSSRVGKRNDVLRGLKDSRSPEQEDSGVSRLGIRREPTQKGWREDLGVKNKYGVAIQAGSNSPKNTASTTRTSTSALGAGRGADPLGGRSSIDPLRR